MSSIATSARVNNTLISIDQICDYVPVASTVTNLVNIFEKCAFSCCSARSINSNRYFTHVKDKSILRCVILLVPILGNIIVGIYDLIQSRKAEAEDIERKNQDFQVQNFQALILGLNVSQLPQNISERRQIIEKKQQEKRQEAIQQSIKDLDMQIVGMRQSVEKFRKIIDNPEESIEVVGLFGLVRGTFDGTHGEKIDYFWSYIKLLYSTIKLGTILLSSGELNQNEIISQKLQEISDLKKESSQLRQTSYRSNIQAIGKEDLLEEAKKYYLQSFLKEEQEGIKASVEQMTLDTILPKLKERVLALAKNDYDIIEMQEIISQIVNT